MLVHSFVHVADTHSSASSLAPVLFLSPPSQVRLIKSISLVRLTEIIEVGLDAIYLKYLPFLYLYNCSIF